MGKVSGGGKACLKRRLFCHLGGHFGFSCVTSVIVFVMTEPILPQPPDS